MTEKARRIQFTKALMFKDSLDTAITQAGGTRHNFNEFSNLTALELMEILSTNNIHFTYMGPK